MRAFLLLFLAGTVAATEPPPAHPFARASAEFQQRIDAATTELAATRGRIGAEKAPLSNRLRALDEQIIALEGEITRLETDQAEVENDRKRLFRERDATHRNLTYLATLGTGAVQARLDTLNPGESLVFGDALETLKRGLETPDATVNARALIQTADALLSQLAVSLGGHLAPGQALRSGSNNVVDGSFAFVGPESFFRPADGSFVAAVRTREGALLPIAVELPGVDPTAGAAVFSSGPGVLTLDASAGKALQLKELEGDLFTTISKGGVVGYLIVGLGGVALLIAVLKLVDLARLSVDRPEAVRPLLTALASGDTRTLAAALPRLRRTTQELFHTGLAHVEKPKELLEEHLLSFVMRQRLHFERRLPLLAVIVTAAPLMGLLGTVTGMVKTFTLITVFGTGSATRLSSGISEALVTTMLGLCVAIPVLVLHGFLSHRIHKSLGLVERFAHEFAVAADDAKHRLSAEVLVK